MSDESKRYVGNFEPNRSGARVFFIDADTGVEVMPPQAMTDIPRVHEMILRQGRTWRVAAVIWNAEDGPKMVPIPGPIGSATILGVVWSARILLTDAGSGMDLRPKDERDIATEMMMIG